MQEYGRKREVNSLLPHTQKAGGFASGFLCATICDIMEFLPIKTRIMQPPKDDLCAVLRESLLEVHEGDIIVLSSKVVAIHEGACVPTQDTDKGQLIEQQADLLVHRTYWPSPLTIIKNAFIGTAGIDESNANEHYILLPENPFKSAKFFYEYLAEEHDVKNIGVIITDSHSTPLRRGATGIAIGWWGFVPTINHVGEADLFGRELKIEVTNLVDGLASGANVVMGETDECQPVALIRDVPNITFQDGETKDELMVPFAEDTFRVLYERFLK